MYKKTRSISDVTFLGMQDWRLIILWTHFDTMLLKEFILHLGNDN